MTVIDDKTAELKAKSARLAEIYGRLVAELSSQVLFTAETTAIAEALLETAKAGELSDFSKSQELWEACELGSFRNGAIVRVREDAYPAAPAAHVHRGKRGTVTAVRGGLVYVRYMGDQGGMETVNRHKPEALQILVTGATR